VPAGPVVVIQVARARASGKALLLGVWTGQGDIREAGGSATAFKAAVGVRVALLVFAGATSGAGSLATERLDGVNTAEGAGWC
jgi:hypothetical protein